MTVGLRTALALLAAWSLALWRSDGCGYTPERPRAEGEPCTRSSECRDELVCRGGVCMGSAPDAGRPGLDAGSGPRPDASGGGLDAGVRDASLDARSGGSGPPDGGAEGADAAPDAA